jgi:glycosyltransferase involved in cell wall biosynthesis
LSIGTLEPRKNYVRLIEAYAALHAAADTPPPPLIIAGGHGWLYEEILAAPARLGLTGQVRFLGKVPAADLPLLLAGAGLFVYPSLYEGFGLPVLEALACGVPVVAADTTSIPEVLGDAGLYCDPLDPASITRALADALATPDVATRLREAGPKQAARFSWQRAARETRAVYEQLHATRVGSQARIRR